MRRTYAGGEHGHTLIELLVAATVLVLVMTALVGVLVPAHSAFRTQPEVSDVQQRLRTGADVLYRDLVAAGAGFTIGPAPGSLRHRLPPIVPYRLGVPNPDPASGTFYRPDAITLVTVVSPAVQCLTAASPTGPIDPVVLDLQPGCGVGDPACGFAEGMRALIADDDGAWDAFTVTGVPAGTSQLDHGGHPLSKQYAAGAYVAAVQTRTYDLRDSPSDDVPRLVRDDGRGSDLPVLDHVVGLRFEYFGEAAPPAIVRALDAEAGPWTTYGPRPPPVGVDNPADSWSAGENCVFRAEGTRQVPRLADLATTPGAVVRLDPGMLIDGPWCPDALFPNRYDADLLRIRRVRVTIRVQAASAVLRGSSGRLFARPGVATAADRLVPDQEITLDVAPRNLDSDW